MFVSVSGGWTSAPKVATKKFWRAVFGVGTLVMLQLLQTMLLLVRRWMRGSSFEARGVSMVGVGAI